ncbi:MAG: hypothetical protein MAG581_01482 [Deltaproteobacteria bacterium]|nr:hypothetical protein [Deltaproteobacteria bacterium]
MLQLFVPVIFLFIIVQKVKKGFLLLTVEAFVSTTEWFGMLYPVSKITQLT